MSGRSNPDPCINYGMSLPIELCSRKKKNLLYSCIQKTKLFVLKNDFYKQYMKLEVQQNFKIILFKTHDYLNFMCILVILQNLI